MGHVTEVSMTDGCEELDHLHLCDTLLPSDSMQQWVKGEQEIVAVHDDVDGRIACSDESRQSHWSWRTHSFPSHSSNRKSAVNKQIHDVIVVPHKF